jgi:18S rRNA (guanine1575-N7)-methyltransferase
MRALQARRPENVGPAELYYNDTRAAQYTSNTRVMSIQSAMTERAIELLNFPADEPKLILDRTLRELRLCACSSATVHHAARLTQSVVLSCVHGCTVGCGSGLSGEVLSDKGHQWVGLDIRCVCVCGRPQADSALSPCCSLTASTVCALLLSLAPVPP